jgi:hydrogenase nickel incorporation protein HypA/HybF
MRQDMLAPARECPAVHELALCQSLLTILKAEAHDRGFRRVRTVQLEVGALSCISVAAIAFCFDAVVRGTLAEGARLDVVERPGEAWCLDCARPVAISQRHGPCPDCGGHRLAVQQGEELRVTELEVD